MATNANALTIAALEKAQKDAVKTPVPGSQESAQAWINNTASGQGGMEAYTAKQNAKYTQATQSNDIALLDKLRADSQRVGYQLNAPAVAAPVAVQSTNTNTAQNYIDSLTNARKSQAIADLGKARDASMSNLASEKSAIQPKYYDARNQAAAGSQQSARNFAEFMAARGGTNSGSNAQAELTRGMTLQGNLGELGRQETQAYGDIERRTSDLQNAYQSDVASANFGLEADRMQSQLNDYYQQQQQELQIAQLMGIYNGQRTDQGRLTDNSILDSNRNYDLNNQQFQWGKEVDSANLTGIWNGGQTLLAQNQQFNQNATTQQNELNQMQVMAQLTGKMPDGTPTNAAQQQQLQNLWAVAEQTGVIPDGIATMYNIPKGTPTAAAKQFAQQLSISQQNASTNAYSADTSRMNANNSQLMDIWKATGNAPAGISGVPEGTPYSSGSSSTGSSNTNYDFQADPSFASGIAWVNQNADTALDEIRKDPATYIQRFGYKGYQELLRAAESVKPKVNSNDPESLFRQ